MPKLYSTQVMLSLIALFSFTSSITASTIHVDLNVSGGLHNGTDWANAFNSLQSALASATNGDEIWITQGTYYPSSSNNRNDRFTIPNGVAVYGGFDGNELTRGERDYVNNLTILSGDIDMDGTLANNSYTVVYTLWVDATTIIDGITITNGNADNPSASNPTAGRSGGGLYNDGFSNPSNLSIKNCIFDTNHAGAFGGAVYNNGDCNSAYENCTFKNNTAFGGGAIYNAGALGKTSNSSFLKCTFNNNFASEAAGAVYNDGNIGESSPTFESCLFSFNSTNSANVTYGGAVYNLGKSGKSNPKFFNCVFNTNATYAGGAVYSLGYLGESSPTFINCSLYKNSASFNGGALYANAGDPSNGISNMNVVNCIFKENAAGPSGGDIFRNNYGCISISYSIVDLADCASLNEGTGKAVVCGAGMQYSTDPLFEDVAMNDFTLKPLSPALDLGDNVSINNEGITTDLSGNNRIYNSTVDIGAYEYQGALPIELLDFTAQAIDGEVLLNWSTLSEENNDYFIIERSSDGYAFEEIGIIEGAGTSYTARQYSYVDETPISGDNYYRLRQIDYDGQYSFSPIRSINFTSLAIKVFPNPVIDHLNLVIKDTQNQTLEIVIQNMMGKQIYQTKMEGQRGESKIVIDDLSKLPAGNYAMSIWNGGRMVKSTLFQKGIR